MGVVLILALVLVPVTVLFVALVYIVSSVFVLQPNSIAYKQSLRTGQTTELRHAGLHILSPMERLLTFPYKSVSASGYVNQFPLRAVRVDPKGWGVVSRNGEEITVDLWVSLLVQDTHRFFFNSFNGDVVGILLDMIRQKVVHVCKELDADAIKSSLARNLDFSELETQFGVKLTIQIDEVSPSDAIREQRANDVRTATARRAEYEREIAAIEHAKRVEASRAAAELERIRLAAEVDRAEIAAQARVDADKHARAAAQAKHDADMVTMQQNTRWTDAAAAARAGVSIDQYVRLKQVEAASHTAANAKVVYLPNTVHPLLMEKE